MSNISIPIWTKDADWQINDDGDATSLANTLTGTIRLVSVGADETRTLAIPLKIGLKLTLVMETDGGDIVVTVGNPGYDEAGNTTLTFNNTGEWCKLESMMSATGAFVWRLTASEGVVGPIPRSMGVQITDPANGGAISPTATGTVRLVSVGADETRTIASPTRVGIQITLVMETDGGDIGVTVASPGYDEAGNTLLTFDNTGEWCKLESMLSASATFCWRLVSYEGVIGPGLVVDDMTLTDLTATTVTVSGLSGLQNITASGTLVVTGTTTTAGLTDSTTIAGQAATFALTVGITGATTCAAITASGVGTFNAGAGIEGDLTMLDGGVVTQGTSITTGVTLNTHSGQITTVASTLAAGAEATFTVTNSKVTALDTISVTVNDVGNTTATAVAFAREAAAGSFDIIITNLGTSALNGTLVINFNVMSGASS